MLLQQEPETSIARETEKATQEAAARSEEFLRMLLAKREKNRSRVKFACKMPVHGCN